VRAGSGPGAPRSRLASRAAAPPPAGAPGLRRAGTPFALAGLLLGWLAASCASACDADIARLTNIAHTHDVSADNALPATASAFMIGMPRAELAARLRACGFDVDLDPHLDTRTREGAEAWLYATRTRFSAASLFLASREIRIIAGTVQGQITTAKTFAFIHGP
jgi:hypothetical protein